MLQLSPNELLEAVKIIGLDKSLTEIEKKVIELRGERDGKVKRGNRKNKRSKTTTTV